MSKYKGLFTFDVDNHKYLPIELADGIITDMDYHPEKEPLIKDEKVKKGRLPIEKVKDTKEFLVYRKAR